VRVNILDPGSTRTDMRAEAMPGEDPETVKAPEDLNHLFLELAAPACTLTGTVVDAKQELSSGHTQFAL
jgi:hypothetical protein